MINPNDVCLFIPPYCGNKKLEMYSRVAKGVGRATSRSGDLTNLPDSVIPMIGGSLELVPMLRGWRQRGRPFIYWDRGYFRRIYEAWLPKSEEKHGGYYRLHLNSFQMTRVRKVPSDRWGALDTKVADWKKNPEGHIVIAPSLPEYDAFHECPGWVEKTAAGVEERRPGRAIVIRHRNSQKPLYEELEGAECLITHGSNAANEAIVMGCPVIVFGQCAAALVGRTKVEDIDQLVYPEREPWLHSMAYSQFTEEEIINGAAFRMLDDGRPE